MQMQVTIQLTEEVYDELYELSAKLQLSVSQTASLGLELLKQKLHDEEREKKSHD